MSKNPARHPWHCAAPPVTAHALFSAPQFASAHVAAATHADPIGVKPETQAPHAGAAPLESHDRWRAVHAAAILPPTPVVQVAPTVGEHDEVAFDHEYPGSHEAAVQTSVPASVEHA